MIARRRPIPTATLPATPGITRSPPSTSRARQGLWAPMTQPKRASLRWMRYPRRSLDRYDILKDWTLRRY